MALVQGESAGEPGSKLAIRCFPLPSFDSTDLNAIRLAFRQATPCLLKQAWLEKPEPEFAPAVVRAGWRGDSFLVFAELTDADIFTRATGHNQRFWELGDTFELFLRPVGQEAYFEFHVAPNNHRLQVRFASVEHFRQVQQTGAFHEVLIVGEMFSSRTWVRAESRQWCVFAEIPAASVCEPAGLLAGSQWFFSFSRYDYYRGQSEPVISSTSPHAQPSFHRQQEWGTMTFTDHAPT